MWTFRLNTLYCNLYSTLLTLNWPSALYLSIHPTVITLKKYFTINPLQFCRNSFFHDFEVGRVSMKLLIVARFKIDVSVSMLYFCFFCLYFSCDPILTQEKQKQRYFSIDKCYSWDCLFRGEYFPWPISEIRIRMWN